MDITAALILVGVAGVLTGGFVQGVVVPLLRDEVKREREYYPVSPCTPDRSQPITGRYGESTNVWVPDAFAQSVSECGTIGLILQERLSAEFVARRQARERRAFLALPEVEVEDCDFGLN